MNKQEYEQKKSECWEDVKALSPFPSREAFYNYVFDRAYALGREKETITQEDVGKAAEEYAINVNDKRLSFYPEQLRSQLLPEYDVTDLVDAFAAGVTFALGKQEKGEENNIDLVKLNKQLDTALNSETKESLEEWMKRGDDSNTRLQIAAQLLSGLLASSKEKHPVRRAIELTDALMEELEKGK